MTPIIWVTSSLLTLAAGTFPAPPAPPDSRMQAWVLRDPDTLRARMEHLRRQILTRTRDAGEARYRALRPKLARALIDHGLEPADAEAILASVDAARRR